MQLNTSEEDTLAARKTKDAASSFMPDTGDDQSRTFLHQRIRELRLQYQAETIAKRTAERMLRITKDRKLRANAHRKTASEEAEVQFANALAQAEMNRERIETELAVVEELIADMPEVEDLPDEGIA